MTDRLSDAKGFVLSAMVTAIIGVLPDSNGKCCLLGLNLKLEFCGSVSLREHDLSGCQH